MNSELNLSAEALSNHLELHRSILRAAMDGFLLMDLEGQLLEVNDAYCRMSGYSESELLAMSVFDLSVFESREQAAGHITKIMERGEDRFETRYRRKDGSIILIEVSAQYQIFEGGRIIIFLRDITERKQAEFALLQEQELYEDLVNTLPAGTYRLRVKSHGNWQKETWRTMAEKQYSLDFASDRFCTILGIGHNTIVADPGVVSDLIHPDDREYFNERNAQAMTDLNAFIWEGRMIRNEQIKWVHFESLPRVIDAETILWTGIVYDITGFKQAEKEREQFFKFFQTSSDLMCLADPNGCFIKTNPSFTETLSYSESELIAKPIVEFIHSDDRQATLDEITLQLQTGFTRNFANRYICRDGSIKWLSWRVNYSKDERIAYATARDITDYKKAEDSLRESEERMTLAMQAGNMGLFDLNVQTGDATVNPEYELMLGYDPTELHVPVAKWLERMHPDDREQVAAVYQAYVRGELPRYKVEFRQRTRDGGWKWILSYGRIMEHDVNGAPRRMLGVHVDIDDRKQAEEALRERKEQLRVIFDASLAGIILVNPQGTIQFANNCMAEMFGMSLGQLIGSSYSEHLEENERQTGDERMRQLIRGDIQSVEIERHYLRADGSYFWGFLSGKRLENPDGTLRALVGIITDITERKQVEETLKESENRLRFALEGSNDGLWDVQMKTGTTYISPRSWEILGYQGDEAREFDSAWSALVHPEDLLLTEERLRQHIDGVTPIFEVEQRLRTKSGDWKWVLARGKVVSRNEHGEPLRITGTHTDLTEQRKLQEQLNQAQKMESVGRLAGGVAHDFNNMLCVILGHAEMARKKEAVSPKLLDHLEQIQYAAERSAEIVRQLLAFARKQNITPRVLDLKENVASMLKMLRRLIGEEINLLWQPDEEVWPVKMDPSQMDQILVNLCVNARDAIAGIGMIGIETRNVTVDPDSRTKQIGLIPGEYVLLTVSDDGCGMDKEISNKIFEPFFTTKEEGQGTGLGLATVYGIVKQNGGFIDVDSEPGQGTSFKIYLPRYVGKEEQARAAGPKAPARRGEETVLLVEDEPAILELAKEILEMQGYHVLTADTPGKAIRIAVEHVGEIHLLITDVVMPEMNGRDLTRKLLSLYPSLKRLFMSGYTADVIAHHGVLDEGVQFIQKPFSLDALAAKAREVLDK
jgi:PAS domain S-box-containing protein